MLTIAYETSSLSKMRKFTMFITAVCVLFLNREQFIFYEVGGGLVGFKGGHAKNMA